MRTLAASLGTCWILCAGCNLATTYGDPLVGDEFVDGDADGDARGRADVDVSVPDDDDGGGEHDGRLADGAEDGRDEREGDEADSTASDACAQNPCGGCEPLPDHDRPCGPCELDRWVCAGVGADRLVCDGATACAGPPPGAWP